jgi:alpha-tubulin suppressor-like RCC1 family protein
MVKGPDGQPLANVTAIDAGDNHVCAIVAGRVWCWGANDTLQLGRAGTSFSPGPISSLVNPVELAVGASYACAIADGDTTPDPKALYCWGSNGNGQLANEGNDTATPQKIPVSLAAVGTLPVAAAGNGHACARDGKDTLWCWGENDFGQLGPSLAPGPDQPVPQSLDVLGPVSMATAGDDYSCILAHDGKTRCLGLDDSAQLGNGTIDFVPPDSGPPPPHTTATLVSGLPPVSRVAAGVEHTCVILARSCPNVPGPVMCWGQNSAGELGGGTMKPSKVPVAVLAP